MLVWQNMSEFATVEPMSVGMLSPIKTLLIQAPGALCFWWQADVFEKLDADMDGRASRSEAGVSDS